jgi:hypothetical protein
MKVIYPVNLIKEFQVRNIDYSGNRGPLIGFEKRKRTNAALMELTPFSQIIVRNLPKWLAKFN